LETIEKSIVFTGPFKICSASSLYLKLFKIVVALTESIPCSLSSAASILLYLLASNSFVKNPVISYLFLTENNKRSNDIVESNYRNKHGFPSFTPTFLSVQNELERSKCDEDDLVNSLH
jgi:hypothetical protein